MFRLHTNRQLKDIIAEVYGHDAIETKEEFDDERVDVSDDATKPSLNEAIHAILYSRITVFILTLKMI